MIKKLLISLVLAVTFCLPCFSAAPTYASDGDTKDDTSCPTFFWLKAWYCDVDIDNIDDEDTLKESIVTIISNVTEDLIKISGYVLLVFIIYGGFMYMISSGDAGKVTTGKKIITNSIIGIIIVAFAYIILNTVRVILLGNGGNFEECATGECVPPIELFGNALNWIYSIAAIIAVIFVIYSGVSYMTSAGESGKIQKAKQTLTYAVIGLIIIALAFSITNFVISIVYDNGTSTDTALIEETHEALLA